MADDTDYGDDWERRFYEKCEPRRDHDHGIIEAEIKRLAKLTLIEYESERIDAANRLNMRASILDRMVDDARPKDDDNNGEGRAVRIVDIEPWPDPVDGQTLAAALVAAVKRYVVMRDDHADAIAFWNLHTWLVNEFYISVRLAITSPTKGCGKTTVLRLLNIISRRPKRSGSISPPALFRAVEKFQPTLLLDETEKYVEHGSDLHALLNEGHCKGASVMRVLGDKLELREFGVYGAAAFARNGAMPDDLDQRSIVIELQRRKADEAIEELREDHCEPLLQLARMCARWAADHATEVRGQDPDLGELINRGGDNWRPILAIANVVGGEWPSRLMRAARKIAPRESSSYGVVLLGDIKAIAADKQTDRLSSSELAATLAEIEGRPWAEWGRTGKPISANQVARLLKEYRIVSGNIRIGEMVVKGYYLHQFQEAFERYLAPSGPNPLSEPPQRYKPTATGTSTTFQTATETPHVADQKCEKPADHGHCSAVADEKGGTGGNGHAHAYPDVWPLICEHCGMASQVGDPVQEVWETSTRHYLHRGCRAEWFGDVINTPSI
jgi:putative DNA primase/helicase